MEPENKDTDFWLLRPSVKDPVVRMTLELDVISLDASLQERIIFVSYQILPCYRRHRVTIETQLSVILSPPTKARL